MRRPHVSADMRGFVSSSLRLYLAAMWLYSGMTKVKDPDWMTSGHAVARYLSEAVAIPPPPARAKIKYGWYRTVLQGLLKRRVERPVAQLLVLSNIATALMMLSRRSVSFGAALGALQNLAFSLAGSAGDNAPMLLAEGILLASPRSPTH